MYCRWLLDDEDRMQVSTGTRSPPTSNWPLRSLMWDSTRMQVRTGTFTGTPLLLESYTIFAGQVLSLREVTHLPQPPSHPSVATPPLLPCFPPASPSICPVPLSSPSNLANNRLSGPLHLTFATNYFSLTTTMQSMCVRQRETMYLVHG